MNFTRAIFPQVATRGLARKGTCRHLSAQGKSTSRRSGRRGRRVGRGLSRRRVSLQPPPPPPRTPQAPPSLAPRGRRALMPRRTLEVILPGTTPFPGVGRPPPQPQERLLDDPSVPSPRFPVRDSGEWAGTSVSQPAPGAGAGSGVPLPEVSTHPRGGWRAAALLNPRAHLHGPAPSVTRLARAGPSPLPLGRSF